MGELFEKSSPTPPQKLSHNRYLNKFVSLHTDGRRASQGRALATASSQAPPRPCELRELIKQKRATSGRPYIKKYNIP